MEKAREYIEEFKDIVKLCEDSKLDSLYYKNTHITIQFNKYAKESNGILDFETALGDGQGTQTLIKELDLEYEARTNNENETTVYAPYIGTIEFGEKLKSGLDTIQISKGEIICTIEAMKIYNDIASPVTGTIVDILIEDGSLVEYDQPLLILRNDNNE